MSVTETGTSAPTKPVVVPMKKKRPYLYEVDLMRIIFIFGVLLNHTTSAFAQAMANDSISKLILHSTHLMLHFTRMGFMFMTGLVLFLNYYKRPQQNWLQFWKKRYTGVGIPYLAWNAILLLGSFWVSGDMPGIWSFIKQWWDAVIYGNQFHLYYVFVMFQLYLIFPLMVWLFKKTEGKHLWVFAISLVIELAELYVVKYIFPSIDRSNWPYLFSAYGLNVLIYQAYFVAGGLAAVHYQAVTQFVEKYKKWIIGIAAVLAVGTVRLYFFNQYTLKLDFAHTETPQQPYIMVYALFMVAVVFVIGLAYSKKRARGISPKIEGFIHLGSQLSFGIYLVHTIPMMLVYAILEPLAKLIPDWGLLLLLPVGYAIVLGGAFLISYFCYKVRPFGILIGRPQKRTSKGVAAK